MKARIILAAFLVAATPLLPSCVTSTDPATGVVTKSPDREVIRETSATFLDVFKTLFAPTPPAPVAAPVEPVK